jgi:TDG/mug DNA glycosylase family protein
MSLQQNEKRREPVLPDLLGPGLRVVFCGMAAGNRSAAAGHYYADPRNRFWRTLFEVGLTDRLLQPNEYARLLDYGIGLTDLAKSEHGMDHQLQNDSLDSDAFRATIERFKPDFVAFNGKAAAETFLLRRVTEFGAIPEQIGATHMFLLPSTSGAASAHWSIAPWRELAQRITTFCL